MGTPLNDDSTAILATVQDFVAALSHNPPAESQAQTHVLPDSFALLSHPDEFRQTRLAQMVTDTCAKIAHMLETGATSVEEVIVEPGPEVWVHANLAAVWAGYSVRIDGVERARGVNAISLLNVPGEGWKISGAADTQWAADAPSPPADDEGLMKPIEAFFEHLKKREWEGMVSVVIPGGGVTLSRPPAAPMFLTFPELFERLKAITDAAPPGTVLEEPIFDVQTRSIGDLGFAWTPCVTTANGVLRSKGTNIFTLLKRDGRWIITGIQDTATYVA
ncbi:hypothetical protein B0H12DRAFT_1097369 [Mycena haematopus]|nr:hypothetical protein B0H12DRAFT_1097369 [Mycena haematopus]